MSAPPALSAQHVGVVGGDEATTDGGAASCRVGTNALGCRVDGMRIASATTDGIVTNWDAAEAILEHTYKSCLSCSPADHPLLMSEASHNSAAAREISAPPFFRVRKSSGAL